VQAAASGVVAYPLDLLGRRPMMIGYLIEQERHLLPENQPRQRC
jgi:hypothetical protein